MQLRIDTRYSWAGGLIALLLCLGCGDFLTSRDGLGRIELLHNVIHLGEGSWYPRLTYVAEGVELDEGATVEFRVPVGFTRLAHLEGALDGKITVSTSGAQNGVEARSWVESGEWRVFVTITDGPLLEGDLVEVNWDVAVPAVNAGRFPIECRVDADGDDDALALRQYPPLVVLPTVVVHSQRVIGLGEKMDLAVEIESGIAGQPYSGTVVFESTDSTCVLPPAYTFEERDGGKRVFEDAVTFGTVGYHEVIVRDSDNNTVAGRASVGCMPEPLEHQLYFGETHEHTSYSDGRGQPVDFWRMARDIEHLDFAMLTDHDYLVDDPTWEELKALCRRWNEPGRFVTFPAYEYSNKLGDKNVYFLDEDGADMLRRTEDRADHPEDLWNTLGTLTPRSLTIPHHAPSAFRPTDWAFHDDRYQRLVEIYSLHGNTEYYRCPNPVTPRTPLKQKYTTPFSIINVREASVHDALARGVRVGFIASGDTHSGEPAGLGLAAVYAPELTRDSIFDALWSRRCYAVTNARIILDFRSGQHYMGEEIVSDDIPEFTVSVLGTEPLRTVEILRNNEVVAVRDGTTVYESFRWKDRSRPDRQTNYYYVRVVQEDGEMAWSSPIWIDRSAPDLRVEDVVAREAGDRIRVEGRVTNGGTVPSTPIDLRVASSLGGDRVARDVAGARVGSLDPGESDSFRVEWEPAEAGYRRLVVGAGYSKAEVDRTNNSVVVDHVVAPRRILRETEVGVATGGVRRPWKEFEFETGDEDIRIEVAGHVDFEGARGRNPRLLDDDIQLVFDGIPLGWAGDQAFDGAHHRAEESRTVVVNRSVSAGTHRLELWSDETPTVDRVEVRGSGRPPTGDRSWSRSPQSATDSDPVRWLNFYFEDGATIFRERIDDHRVRVVILWSKDWESTSPFTEQYRWYMGELRLRNVAYSLRPWRFAEESDHLWEDGSGTVSFVARANKACGLEIVCELLSGGSPEIVVDLWNGGERFPAQTYVGSAPVEGIPFVLPLTKGATLESGKGDLGPTGAVSLAMDRFSEAARGVPFAIEQMAKDRESPEQRRDLLLAAIEQEPDRPRLRYFLGLLHKDAEEWGAAFQAFEEARERGMDNVHVSVNLAEVEQRRNHHQEAVVLFQSVIEEDPFSVRGRLGLGRSYRRLGDPRSAEDVYREITEIQSFNARGHYLLGEMLAERGAEEEAKRSFRKVLALTSTDSGLYHRSTAMLTRLGEG